MRFTVSAETLRHVRPFCSNDANRPVLGGVCIETTGVVAATNGHRLLAVAPLDDGYQTPAADVVVRLPKAAPSWAIAAHFDIPDDATDGTLGTVTYVGTKKQDVHPAVFVAGPYPYWRQTVPREVARNHAMPPINGEYLADFAACANAGSVWVLPDVRPERAMRVEMQNRPNYLGVLMPMRADHWPAEPASIPAVLLRRPEPTVTPEPVEVAA